MHRDRYCLMFSPARLGLRLQSISDENHTQMSYVHQQ